MSASVNLSYDQLEKLMNNLRFIMQSGGNPLAAGATGSTFWERFVFMNSVLRSILMFIVLLIAFYLLYILVFKGYPRALFNLATLSFHKQENVDKFLDSRGFMFAHLKQLLTTGPETYATVASVYGVSTTLRDKAAEVDRLMKKYYKGLRPEDQLREMFREFYLFYNAISVNRKKKVYSWIEFQLRNPGTPIPMQNSPEAAVQGRQRMTPKPVEKPTEIQYTDFYELLVEYKRRQGKLTERDMRVKGDNQRRKNNEELVIEFYIRDRIKQERGQDDTEYGRVKALNAALRALATECNTVVRAIRDTPLSFYLLLPETTLAVQQFRQDYEPRKELVANGKIYDAQPVKFKEVNELSWFLFEILQPGTPYAAYAAQLEPMIAAGGPRIRHALAGYLNLPYAKRIAAPEKLAKSFPELKRFMTPALFSFLNKHPIFSRIYLSWMVETQANTKAALYAKVLQAYRALMGPATESNATERVERLRTEGANFQMLLNAGSIMDLYLTDYLPSITRLYEEQYMNNEQFFMALWKPYFVQIFMERIVERLKRNFSGVTIKESWNRFRYRLWGYGYFGRPKSGLGKILYSLSDTIWKMFTAKADVNPPPPPEQDNGQASSDPDDGGGF